MENARNHVHSDAAATAGGVFCPHPEVLAAWVDQGLGAAERAQVEAHLASCDDCRILVAHVLEIQDALQEATPEAPPQSSPGSVAAVQAAPRGIVPQPVRFNRKLMTWGGGVLALAAALVLAIRIQPSWWPGSADSRLADLADAVGQERTVEARLTGGFRYGPVRAPVRSGGSTAPMDNWRLYAAAGRIREDAERDPSAVNLHALGLSYLLLGRHDEAIQAFEDALTEDSTIAGYHNDLAAAYLARAKQLDRPDDLPRALGAAERAIGANGSLIEAYFNRALALQALFLEEQARAAWEDYLKRDTTSEWAEEARRHLAALQQSALARADLARINSPPPITDATVEAALDWVLRLGLPAWADAVLAGDAARASREQSTLTSYADDITTTSGDPYPSALVALPSPDDQGARIQAEALAGLGRGLTKLSADDQPGGEKELRVACPLARGAAAMLCELELGALDVLHRDGASAARRTSDTLAAARRAGYAYAEGRALQLEGYRHLFRSDYGQSIAAYRQALETLEPHKYLTQAGSASAQVAELLDVIGMPLQAWRWRYRSLEAAARTDSPTLQYAVSQTTAGLLARAGDYQAGQAFLSAWPARSSLALRRVPALLTQARAALLAQDVGSAREALMTADNILRVPDVRAARLMPEVNTLFATVLFAEGRHEDAETKLNEALKAMGPERAFQRAGALLERARIRTARDRDLESAERDIREAVALLDERSAPAGEVIRLSDAAIASGAIAALASASPGLQSAKGLALAEQLRELLDGVPAEQRVGSITAIENLAARFSNGSVGVYFLFSNDSLLTWILADGRVEFTKRPLDQRLVGQHAARLAVQIARTPEREDLWRQTLIDLYDLVLRDLPLVGSAANIVVVPDGPLHRVPFGSLIDRSTGQFLFERTAVRVASTLAYAGAPALEPISMVLAVGDPLLNDDARSTFRPLPNARAEAVQVAALYPKADVLLGGEATKSRILAKMPQATVIHYAGHAVAPSSGGAARLLLAGNAEDPTQSLAIGDLKARLTGARVVLAACDTASARPHDRATGISSLAGDFLRAGASSVVATLWKVDDAASEGFFVDVHRGLSSGQSPALAVARAQRACGARITCRRAASTWIGTTVYGHH